jgi:hypothetical protein
MRHSIILGLGFLMHAAAQVPGPSTNMVSGTQWPGGDPFLQRQNEPSMAVSSRHPMHLLAGANDYRTVDLPGVATDKPTGDAWLGLFKSFDGGATWRSTLIPGYPQDTSPEGMASPLKGLSAAADPWVRAGTNGMFYYSGLAFDREKNPASTIFVTRFIDDNNFEGGDTIRYLGTSIIAEGKKKTFLDKPAMVVDIPRPGSPVCRIPGAGNTPEQSFAAGRIYVAYTEFKGDEAKSNTNIMLSESNDCGVTWSKPVDISGNEKINQGAILAIDPNDGTLYVFWRVFASKKDTDSIVGVASEYGSKHFTKVMEIAQFRPFDQGTTDLSFRTNAFPAAAVDASGNVYVAWSQRGLGMGGDARVVVLAAKPVLKGKKVVDLQAAGPIVVDPHPGRGHQIMPALAFSSGKLTAAWYDFRDNGKVATYVPSGGGLYSFTLTADGQIVFGDYAADPDPRSLTLSSRRQTVDIRAAQAPPGTPPVFRPSVRVSQYAYGSVDHNQVIRQLEFHAPNLPLFQRGTVPFVGDYIDIAGPTFIPNGSTWRYNNLPTDPDHTHIIWTDNRNVVPPADGNWTNYTPVGFMSSGASMYDPTQQRPACQIGQAGMRNQDIYTATLSQGVILGIKGNDKPLSPSLQRQFAVTVRNTTEQTRYYRLSIGANPPGGTASFLQFVQPGAMPVTQLDVTIQALSSAARSVFITSSDPNAQVPVSAEEITGLNGSLIPSGLSTRTVVNSDVSNPNISNPNISNVELSNPNISNPNISNPNISNPNISNPNISNPNISNTTIVNPNISNPNISNPNISNPNISNPNISNPNISNPNISNTALTDVSYTVTNTGNTAATYTVKLLERQPAPSGVTVQLIVSGIYTTPVANGCTLTVQAQYVPILNIASPVFSDFQTLLQPGVPAPDAPTFALAPNETAMVTIRAYDFTTSDPAAALQRYNPATQIVPVVVSNAVNTGETLLPSTPIPQDPLTITTASLPNGTVGTAYSQSLAASGGTGGGYVWSATATPPPGLSLTPAGVLQGTPTTAGSSSVSVQVTDSASNTVMATIPITIQAALTITTTSLPNGTVGSAYSQSLAASGGTGAGYTWSATATPPPGLSLTPAGVLQGTPTTAGSSSVSVQVTDSASNTVTATIPITIQAALTITTASLPTGTVGTAYSQSLAASGGTGAGYVWSATATLPAGLSLTPAGVLQGTPTTAGSSSVSVQVTDSASNTATATIPITIQAPLTITTASLPTGTVGSAYSQSLAASGGTGAGYVWSATTPLPDGLTFTADGVLQGTPTTAGNSSIGFQVTDSGSNTATATLNINIQYPLLLITTASLPNGTVNAPYTHTLSASGGTGAGYVWSATTPLPDGLTFTADGVLQGTPTTAGNSSIGFQVTDSGSNTGLAILNINIQNPPLTITTASLPNASAGAPYSQSFAASGGTGIYSWLPVSSLPPGMNLTTGGILQGTTFSTGSHSITVEVTDSALATAQTTLNLTVLAPPQMSNPGPALGEGTQNTAYTQFLFTFGGATPATWSATGLPPGIAIDASDASTGRLSGTPTTAGDYTTTITVTGADGAYQSRVFTIKINPPLAFVTTSPLPDRYWGVPYTQTFVASGGTAPLSYSLIGGFLPGGYVFNGGGTLSATPQFPPVSNTYTLTIRVSDSKGAFLDQDFDITYRSLLTIPPVPHPTLTQNAAMTPITMTASGGTAPYTWSLQSGTLPSGVTLDPSGQLSGTPTFIGFHQVRFTVTDATGAYGISEFLNITVIEP